jgi:ribonuclease HII
MPRAPASDASLQDLLRQPLSALAERYVGSDERSAHPLPQGLLAALEADPRAGARALARRLRARQGRNRAEGQRLRNLLRFEVELWEQGLEHVAGVDEAGMAPLAGPVVAAAAILPRGYRLRGLDDSKKILDERRREELAQAIKRDALAWGVGIAEVEEIDRLNIYHAGLLAMRRAVLALGVVPHFALVDARKIPECPCPQRGIIHGDALSLSIAAASVLAKTTRDRMMVELDARHPGYGLAIHKGYPTPRHLQALKERGVLPIHRRSFAPVREALGLGAAQQQQQGELFGAPAPVISPPSPLGEPTP